MSIIHVRIDERLIHGQVATMWTNTLHATRIMVVDDDASENSTVKMTLKLATPTGVSLSVLGIERAATRINEGSSYQQKVFMVVKSPLTLVSLIDLGVHLEEVGVGNIYDKKDKINVASSIYISKEMADAFYALNDAGIHLVKQLVPSHKVEEFMPLLEAAVSKEEK